MSKEPDNSKTKLKEAAVAYLTSIPVNIPPSEDDLFHSDGKYVSEEDYFKYFYEFGDINYEWNNGILEAKPLADVAKARMYAWFLRLVMAFLETHPIAGYTLLEIGFRIDIPDPNVRGATRRAIRKPDLGIVLNDNPIPLNDDDRTYKGICDLCIESLSDSTQKEVDRDIIEKKLEYSSGGVKEYFIIDETNDHMHFYRLNDLGKYIEIKPDASGIIRSNVLTGFEFRVDDLNHQPSMGEMVVDPLYRSYVFPEHFALVQEKENALAIARREQRKRQEEERKRQESSARVDHLEALLRKHGIDPNDEL